jgi:NAD+ kinase
MTKPPESIAIVPAHDKRESHELFDQMAAWLRERSIPVVSEDELRRGGRADALIVLGGDGLMMRMARAFPGIPILGINFGTVGFMAMAERAQWKDVLQQLLSASFRYQDGPILKATLRRDGQDVHCGIAINDVVIRSGTRMVDTELYIDKRYVNIYPGDGMIVATPQGSTAYCMAAGGPILIAGVRGFAVTPLSPHSPIRATLVVPETSLIELVVANDRRASLILDGAEMAEIGPDDIIVVERAAHPFRLIILEDMDFYEAFRSKFNYLIRPGAQPSLGNERC